MEEGLQRSRKKVLRVKDMFIILITGMVLSFQGGSVVKKKKKKICIRMQETLVPSLDGEDPLEKEMATHSRVLAWRIAWTEQPGGLQSMVRQRVRHDLVTKRQQWCFYECTICQNFCYTLNTC